MKILIAGVGGVGGFLGARLAAEAENTESSEIYFLCRGQHLQHILQNGLRLQEPNNVITGKPKLAANSCADFPVMDIVLVCCKNYDLDNICEQIQPCIGPSTLLIPVLNGLERDMALKQRSPKSFVANSCIYIVSRLEAPGLILMTGASHSMFIGGQNLPEELLLNFKKICVKAGINLEVVDDIDFKVWKKFSFISPVASLTSALGATKGEIINNSEHYKILISLMEEVIALAQKSGVNVPDDMLEQNLAQFAKMPDSGSSSMERDYRLGNRTEMETLTEVVLTKAEVLGLDLTTYKEIYSLLQLKESQ